MDRASVIARIERAVAKVVSCDDALLRADANERTLTHRLALYLEADFQGWHVDCEYNRSRHDPKFLALPVEYDVSTADPEARTVFPDVIVHKRDSSENLVVIEAKKTTSRSRGLDDRVKLRAYVQQLGYQHAVFVCFATHGRPELTTVEYVEADA